jgi:hypothetical protein
MWTPPRNIYYVNSVDRDTYLALYPSFASSKNIFLVHLPPIHYLHLDGCLVSFICHITHLKWTRVELVGSLLDARCPSCTVEYTGAHNKSRAYD